MICENPSRTVPLAESAVQSVNGKPGPAPSLNAEDVGAAPKDEALPSVAEAGNPPVGNHELEQVDLLNVDHNIPNSDINKPFFFGSDNPSNLINSPYTAGPFYGYRQVLFGRTQGGTPHLITVLIIETYPVTGRIWANSLEASVTQWYGWHGSNMT